MSNHPPVVHPLSLSLSLTHSLSLSLCVCVCRGLGLEPPIQLWGVGKPVGLAYWIRESQTAPPPDNFSGRLHPRTPEHLQFVVGSPPNKYYLTLNKLYLALNRYYLTLNRYYLPQNMYHLF